MPYLFNNLYFSFPFVRFISHRDLQRVNLLSVPHINDLEISTMCLILFVYCTAGFRWKIKEVLSDLQLHELGKIFSFFSKRTFTLLHAQILTPQRERERECVCVCERQREREGECECECVYLCVCEKEREREGVRVSNGGEKETVDDANLKDLR